MTKSNNTPIKRTQRDYSLGFKLQVVDAVEKGDMTYKQAQKFRHTVSFNRAYLVKKTR